MTVESFPPAPRWTVDDVPDLSGKVILVTGGYSGIALGVIKVLLTRGAKVYMAGRSQSKAEEAIEIIKAETGGKAPVFLYLDLADLTTVKAAANEFLSKENRLDILFNSAGVMIPPKDQLTVQGYDLQFGINALGHFYLTKLLLPTLVSTAKLNPDGKVRVVAPSSGAHHLHGLSFDTFKDGPARNKLGEWSLYSQSKYAVVVVARELARRYGDQGIVSLSLNPGNVNTNLQRRVPRWQHKAMALMLHPVEPNGRMPYLWAATAPETADYNGKYIIPWGRVGKARADTQDPKVGAKLWEWLDEQVKGL